MFKKGDIPWNKDKPGHKHNESTKEKISKSNKGKNISKETRKKISEKMKGKNNPNYGKEMSEEQKLKISKARKGIKHSEETKQKMRETRKKVKPMLGRKHSEETKQKMRENHADFSGENNPMYGKEGVWKDKSSPMLGRKHTDETKQKIKEKHLEKNKTLYTKEYISNNIPLYDSYFYKLTLEEDPKRDLLDTNILTVKCFKCEKRFIPSLSAVHERVRSINRIGGGTMLYCSEECKMSCSIFKKIKYQQGHPIRKEQKSYTQEEYNIFRKIVLERDNYICQYCGKLAEHVHHSRPQKLEPFFTLDPDLAISVCSECHYKYAHKDECSTGKLANKIC